MDAPTKTDLLRPRIESVSEPEHVESLEEPETCQPDCAGKECGGDGCDGTCGDCAMGMFCSSYSCLHRHVWSRAYGGDWKENVYAVAAYPEGGVALSGAFGSTDMTFGGESFSTEGGVDIYVARLNDQGEPIWTRAFGGSGWEAAARMSLGLGQRLHLTGYFDSSALDLGGGELETNGQSEGFILALDKNGDHVWSKSFGGDGEEWGAGIASDLHGGIYVAGGSDSDTVDLGEGEQPTEGGDDILMMRLDHEGNYMWSRLLGGDGDDRAGGLAVDTAGNSYIAGSYESLSLDFEAGGHGNAGGSDILVVKLAPDGSTVWSRSFGAEDDDYGTDIDLDDSGNVLLCGFSSSSSLDFGGGVHHILGFQGMFVVKLDPSGQRIWSRIYGGALWEEARALAVGPAGSLFVTGRVSSSGLDFGNGDLPIQGGDDVFLLKLDSAGKHLWSHSFGGEAEDIGTSVAVSNGHVFLGGYFESESFAPGASPLPFAGERDIFVSKFID